MFRASSVIKWLADRLVLAIMFTFSIVNNSLQLLMCAPTGPLLLCSLTRVIKCLVVCPREHAGNVTRAYYGMSDEFSGGPAFCKISSAFLKNDVFWLVCFCRLFHFHYFFNGGRIEMRGTTKWRWLIVRLFVLLVSCNVILDYFEIIILSCFNLKTFTFQSLQQQ